VEWPGSGPPLRPEFVAGIDVSATRGLDAAILASGGKLIETTWLPDLDGLRVWLDVWAGRLAAVAVDAPASTAHQPGGRIAERVLRARGVSLYLAPTVEQPPATWMVVGWRIFRLLEWFGFPEARLPRAQSPDGPRALECFPYAAYVAWTGKGRPKTMLPAVWARRVLRQRGYTPPGTGKDAPDAIAAALAAYAWMRGEAVPYGDPAEGVIWTPCALPEKLMSSPGRAPSAPPLPLAGEGAGG